MDMTVTERRDEDQDRHTELLIERVAAEANGDPRHWVRIAKQLRDGGSAAEADAVLHRGQEVFPDAHWLLFEYAYLADHQRNWPESIRRWTLMAERFPDRTDGLVGLARVATQQGDHERAHTLLIHTLETFPTTHAILHVLARATAAAQNWKAAERWWRLWLTMDQGAWWDYGHLATALREQGDLRAAERVLTEQFERFSNEPKFFAEYARLAEHAKDWPKAAERYQDLIRRFPDVWDGYAGHARVLRAQGDIDALSTMLEETVRRFPERGEPLAELARAAQSRRDWVAAEYWWRRFVSLDPSVWWALAGLAEALREQDRVSEGEAVLLASTNGKPLRTELLFEYARLAERANNWRDAAARWAEMIVRNPDRWEAFLGRAKALEASGSKDQLIEADELFRQAQDRFADKPFVLTGWIEFRMRNKTLQSETSLADLERRVDIFVATHRPTAHILRWQSILRRLRGDYAGCAAILTAAVKLFPTDRHLRDEVDRRQELLLDHHAPDDVLALAEIPAATSSPTMDALLPRFESLGGGGPRETGWGLGCEFGFFQRRCAYEPLGLLRWASIGPEGLIQALTNRLADVGDVTSLRMEPHGNGEWGVTDLKYNIIMHHTQLMVANVSAEDAARRVAARMKFLCRKLTEDLEQAEKIFIYRVFGRKIDHATMLRLHDAVRLFGNGILLIVTYADDDNPFGTVKFVRPGLLLGFIDWFSAERQGYPVNVEGWTRICQAALEAISKA